MLSSMTEISQPDLNNQGRSRSVDREGIGGKQIRSNRSLCTQDIQWLAPNGRRLLLMKPGKLLKLAEGTGLEPA